LLSRWGLDEKQPDPLELGDDQAKRGETGEEACDAELHRLNGELLLREAANDDAAAEAALMGVMKFRTG
jgi:hypothetical protein